MQNFIWKKYLYKKLFVWTDTKNFFQKKLYLNENFLCLKIFYCKIYNGKYFKSKLIKFYRIKN